MTFNRLRLDSLLFQFRVQTQDHYWAINVIEALQVIKELHRSGVHVIFEQESLDSSNPEHLADFDHEQYCGSGK